MARSGVMEQKGRFLSVEIGRASREPDARRRGGAQYFWLFWLFLWLCGGCQDGEGLELFRLAGTQPEEIEPSDNLVITGGGFPVGRDCEVLLEGKASRPGAPERPTRVVLSGKATSHETVEATVDRTVFRQLGGFGSFRGGARVSFAARAGEARIEGSLADVRFDLVEQSYAHLAAREERLRRARQVLAFLGIESDESEGAGDGLTVKRVRLGSRALAAGIQAGDVIVALSGVRIHSASDFAPAPGAGKGLLRIRRPGERRLVELTVTWRGLETRLSGVSTAYLVLLAALLAAASVLRFRGQRFIEYILKNRFTLFIYNQFVARLSFNSEAIRDEWKRRWYFPPTRLGRPAAPLRAILLPLGAGALVIAPVVSRKLTGMSTDPLFILFMLTGLSLTRALAAEGRLDLSTRRLRRAAGELARAVGLYAPVVCACALAGARSLDAIVSRQGALPWRWSLFENPAFALAFPLYLASCAADLRVAAECEAEGVFGRLVAVIEAMALCGIGAAIFWGGWQIEGIDFDDPSGGFLVAALIFSVKSLAFGYLVYSIAVPSWGFLRNGWVRASIAITCAVITAFWIVGGTRPELEAVFGQTLFAAACAAAVVAWPRKARIAAPVSIVTPTSTDSPV